MIPAASTRTHCIPQVRSCSRNSRSPLTLPACQQPRCLPPARPVSLTIRTWSAIRRLQRFVALGFKSVCSAPLITRDRIFGTLALSRMTDDEWTPDDVDFLAQVASQIAIAVENSLAYRELARNEGAARHREALPGRRDPRRPQHRKHGGRRAGFSSCPEEYSDRGADATLRC